MKDGIKQHKDLQKEKEEKRRKILENRALEMRRKAGIFWCALIIILSFFPMIYIGDEKKNMFQVLLLAVEKSSLILAVIAGVLILIPLLYAGRLVYYIIRRDGFLYYAVAPFVNLLGALFIFIFTIVIIVAFPEKSPFGNIMWPTTMWLAFRTVLAPIEYVNRTSGEEIFLSFVTRKDRKKSGKR